MNEQEHHELRVPPGGLRAGPATRRRDRRARGAPRRLRRVHGRARGADPGRRRPRRSCGAVPHPDGDPRSPADSATGCSTPSERRPHREGRRTWRRAASLAAAAAVIVVVVALERGHYRRERSPASLWRRWRSGSSEPGWRLGRPRRPHLGGRGEPAATGFDRGGRYRVAVLGVDGKRYPAGGFVGTGARRWTAT